MKNCKELAHWKTQVCEEATITFYSIIHPDFKKILKIRGKPQASRTVLARREAFFP